MQNYHEIAQALKGARDYLKQRENRTIEVTLADVAQPVELIAIDLNRHESLAFGRTTLGKNVTFLIEHVRLIAEVPATTVSADERDATIEKEVANLSSRPEVRAAYERLYNAIKEDGAVADMIAQEARNNETPHETFMRIEIATQFRNAWEPFIDRENWINQVVSRVAI